MIYLLPFIISTWIGFSLFLMVKRPVTPITAFDLIISFFLGVGVCSLTVFYTLVFKGFYDPFVVLGFTVFLSVISFLNMYVYRRVLMESVRAKSCYSEFALFLCVGGIGLALILPIALNNIFGDWDAWSFWNYIPHFFANGGAKIEDLYVHASEARHPWFLPCWNLFGTAILFQETVQFPMVSSVVFALSLVATVFVCVLRWTGRKRYAVLACVWLESSFVFCLHSVSQYADVLMAVLILVNVMIILREKKDPQCSNAVLLGFMLGLMAFLKDDGIMSAGILLILSLPLFKKNKKFILFLGMSFVSVFMATMIVKYWMRVLPKEESQTYWPYFFDIARWLRVMMLFWSELCKEMFGCIFIVPIGVIVLRVMGIWDYKISFVVRFVSAYCGAFIFFLVIRHNLEWYFGGTAYRFIYQLLPLLIVLFIYGVSKLMGKGCSDAGK